MNLRTGFSSLFAILGLALIGCPAGVQDPEGGSTAADGGSIDESIENPESPIFYDIDLETTVNPKNQASGDDDVETIRPYLRLKMNTAGTIETSDPITWENCRLLFLLGPEEMPEEGAELSYDAVVASYTLPTLEEASETITLDESTTGIITHDIEPGRYNIWHKVECGVGVTVHEEDDEQEDADEDAEPETFLAENASISDTTVEVTEPSEAMIFEEFHLSTEVLVVNLLRNEAVMAHPDNPEQRIYQPPHARRPILDKPLISISTAVTQAGIKPDMDAPALPEGHHLDWNFTLELVDEHRPEGLPGPVKFQLSCKDRALSENGNRVDGRVTFPAVSFPHQGGTAHYHCDAQVAPPAILPADAPIDPLADFANVHSDLFDLNAQMDYEYPDDNRRNGWWAVSVCMEHWENIGTPENPEKQFFRKRCAKKRLYVTKSDNFRVRGDAEGPRENGPGDRPNPDDTSDDGQDERQEQPIDEDLFKSTSTLFGVSETFADPSSGDNQLKADFEAGVQAVDDDDMQGFRIGAGGEAYLDLLDGALEVSLVAGSLWAGYDVDDESGYYEAGLEVFESDVFDESSSNDIELSIEESASYSYTYSLSYGILGIITINFDMGFGASAGFEAGITLEVDSDVDSADANCMPGEDEVTVIGRAGPVAGMSASIGVSVTVLFWQGGVEATLNIIEAYVGPELDVGACLITENNTVAGFYLFSGVWFGVEIEVLSGDIEAYVKWVWWCGGGTIWSGTLYEFDGITFTYDLLDEEFDLNGTSTCGNQLDVFNDDARGYAFMKGVKCSSLSGAGSLITNTSISDMLETCEADSDCVGFNFNHTNNKGKTFTGCSSSSNSSNHITVMATDSCSASVFD